MSINCTPIDSRDEFLERLAGKLTATAYNIILQHGNRDSWLDLQLDLWRALTQSVRDSADKLESAAAGSVEGESASRIRARVS